MSTYGRKMSLAYALLLAFLAFRPLMLAQAASASGRLTVVATVVSSSILLAEPGGAHRLVVTNSCNEEEIKNLQLAINHSSSAQVSFSGTVAVRLVPANNHPTRIRAHHH